MAMAQKKANKKMGYFFLMVLILGVIAVSFFLQKQLVRTGDFQIKNGTLIRYLGSGGDVLIPEGVQEIGRLAFQDCDGLVRVTVPLGVETIDEGAFAGCSNLKEVILPESLKRIEIRAFSYDTALESISLPEKLEYIASETFYGCESLRKVEMGPCIEWIGDYSFYQCGSLEAIVLPENVASVGNSTFSGCRKLRSVTLPEYNFNMGSNVFANCSSLEHIVLPENLKYINTGTFWNCASLKSITIPKNVNSVGDRAFHQCVSLQSIVFPEKVTSIGNEAFYGCESLQSIELPETQIRQFTNWEQGEGVGEKSEKDDKDEDEVEYLYSCYIGMDCFAKCTSLDHVYIPAHVTMSPTAFFECSSLKRFIVDEDHKQYMTINDVLYSTKGENLFIYPAGLAQESFKIPDRVKYIEERAFSGAGRLKFVKAGSNLKSIANAAFYRCEELVSVELNDTLEYIAQEAFKDCLSLQRLVIPAECYMERNALTGCCGLAEINVDERNRSYKAKDGVLFDYGFRTLLLYPPMKRDTQYTVPETVETIGEYAFSNNLYLEVLNIPENVVSIQRRALAECVALRQVTLTDSVLAMDSEIFYGTNPDLTMKIEAVSEKCVPVLYADNVGIEYEWVKK